MNTSQKVSTKHFACSTSTSTGSKLSLSSLDRNYRSLLFLTVCELIILSQYNNFYFEVNDNNDDDYNSGSGDGNDDDDVDCA